MSLVNLENQEFRREILNLLNADSDYAMNEISLYADMRNLGFPIAHDRLKTQLNWLAEQGLVTLQSAAGSNYVIAKLTAHGSDVVQGLANVPNIARPRLS